MPDARLTISIDDNEARVTLARLQSDVERTASLIEASSRRTASLVPSAAGGGLLLSPGTEAQRVSGQIAAQLGTSQAAVLEAFRQSSRLATPLVPGAPGVPGHPGGGLDLTAHAGGLQAVAHGVRSVADSYAYRVSPALAEVNRSAATFLQLSGSTVGIVASIALSAATLLAVRALGSDLGLAKKEAEELSLALRSGDIGRIGKVAEGQAEGIRKLDIEIEELDSQILKRRELAKAIGPSAAEAGIPAGGFAGLTEDIELNRLTAERERRLESRKSAEESLAQHYEERDRIKALQTAEKERRELLLLTRAETETGGSRAISLAQARVEETAKLAQGERQLRLERVEENRATAIARTQTEGVAAAEEDAAKRRTVIALQQADLENQIRTRRAYLAEAPFLTGPQRAKEEAEIAERRAKQLALQEQLDHVDLERDQKFRGVGQKSAEAEFQLARTQEQDVFNIKKALGEVSLQDELARLDRLIAATAAGSAERIRLEEERATKTREIRDRAEGGAGTATDIAVREYEKQLKAAGVQDAGRVARETPLTDADIAALTQAAELRARGTLEQAGLGAGISATARLDALRTKGDLRGLGLAPGARAGLFGLLDVQGVLTAGEATEPSFVPRPFIGGPIPERASLLAGAGGIGPAATEAAIRAQLGMPPSRAATTEAELRAQLGLPPLAGGSSQEEKREWWSYQFGEKPGGGYQVLSAAPGFGGQGPQGLAQTQGLPEAIGGGMEAAWTGAAEISRRGVETIDGIIRSGGEQWALSIEERVLERLRELLFRDGGRF